MTAPIKHLSQKRTLKPNAGPYSIHHQSGLTPLRQFKLMILLPKLVRKTNLVSLEAVNRTWALILILTAQKYTGIDVCKNLFQSLQCVLCILHFFTILSFFPHTHYFLFSFWVAKLQIVNINKNENTWSTTKQWNSSIQKFMNILHQKFYALIALYQSTNWKDYHDEFPQYQCVSALQGYGVDWVIYQAQTLAHTKKMTFPHHSGILRPYTIFPIHFQFCHTHVNQLTPKVCSQTEKLYQRKSQATLNMTRPIQGL